MSNLRLLYVAAAPLAGSDDRPTDPPPPPPTAELAFDLASGGKAGEAIE